MPGPESIAGQKISTDVPSGGSVPNGELAALADDIATINAVNAGAWPTGRATREMSKNFGKGDGGL